MKLELGYWMPFEAARALAANFCWEIRFALTPIFGPDFPSTCLHPDSCDFGEMIIDPEIIKECTAKAKQYKALESGLSSRESSIVPTPLTPESIQFSRQMKSPSIMSAYDEEENVYPGPNNTYDLQSPCKRAWTSINEPRTVPNTLSSYRPEQSYQPSKHPSPMLSPPESMLSASDLHPAESRSSTVITDDRANTANLRPEHSAMDKRSFPCDMEAALVLMNIKNSRVSERKTTHQLTSTAMACQKRKRCASI